MKRNPLLNFKEKLKAFIKNRKGSLTPMFVVWIMALVIFCCGYVYQYMTNVSLVDLDATLDLTAVESLRAALDEDLWRSGVLEVDEKLCKQKFIALLSDNLPTGAEYTYSVQDMEISNFSNGVTPIEYIKVIDWDIFYDEDSLMTSSGGSGKSVFLETLCEVKLKVSPFFDVYDSHSITYYDLSESTKDGMDNIVTVQSEGEQIGDGYIIQYIHTIGKVTLR